jgi:hypothetical protein
MGAAAKGGIGRNWLIKMSMLERSRRRSLLTEVPVDCLVQIANFVASGGLCDEKDGRKGAKGGRRALEATRLAAQHEQAHKRDNG